MRPKEIFNQGYSLPKAKYFSVGQTAGLTEANFN